MARAAIAAAPRDEAYRSAERRLWRRYGLEPAERFLHLESIPLRLRALEVGSGEPVLLVHGTVGPGGWPSLIGGLPGFRSIVLERPGWGSSDVLDFSGRDYGAVVAEVLRDALDALELERVHVLGGSIGNVWALRLAERYPDRVDRIVLLGSGPVVADAGVPGFIRLLASPLGTLMLRVPHNAGRVRSILRQSGHGASLDSGLIPGEFVEWRVAVGRLTDSMRNEREMVATIVKGNAYRPTLTFDETELAAVRQPTLLVYGTADPLGSPDFWAGVVRGLQHGELRLIDGAGHMPWFDDRDGVAGEVARFLSG
jgi:pimeloyl-ACP methyl ester carboxylesterase